MRLYVAVSLMSIAACSQSTVGDEGVSHVDKSVACSTSGCAERLTEMKLSPAPPSLAGRVQGNGLGLPVTVSKAAQEAFLARARVTVNGALVAGVGPLGLEAQLLGNTLTLQATLMPVPNASFVSAHLRRPARATITHVRDLAEIGRAHV